MSHFCADGHEVIQGISDHQPGDALYMWGRRPGAPGPEAPAHVMKMYGRSGFLSCTSNRNEFEKSTLDLYSMLQQDSDI